jgi:phage gpG-like protein
MTTGIKLDIVGTDGFSRSMDALAQHLGEDLRPMLRAIRDWWHTWQDAVFASEGGEIEQWAQLSPKYKEWKEKKYPGQPILQLTGKLRAAMTGDGGSGAWEKVNRKDMTLGIEGIPYWVAHNFPGGKIPQRKFVDTTKQAQVDLEKRYLQPLLADIKREILRAAGGPGGMAR